jgi:hypothetical protein
MDIKPQIEILEKELKNKLSKKEKEAKRKILYLVYYI